MLGKAIDEEGKNYSLEVSGLPQPEPSLDETKEGIAERRKPQLTRMKQTGITTIFLAIEEPSKLLELADTLDDLEMPEDVCVYILPPTAVPTDDNLELL